MSIKEIRQAMQEVAISLLDILEDETIATKTGLTLEKVKLLRYKQNNI